MKALDLEFGLSPTQEEYVYSEKVVNILISNAGEGKSYASVIAMIIHAQRCGRPIRCAIVRDTHENIKLSTARTIQEVFEKSPQSIRFKNDFKQLTINSNPRVDVDLFGIDDLGALSKLQGPEYALIWLEEPAPMADKVNAGLSEEVYNAALLRCARQKGTKARLQVSMNPADEEHWTYRRFIEDPDFDPANPLITKQVWFIPYGENSELSEVARQAAKAAYKDDPASYARYVEGKFAEVYRGEKVTPQYKPERHLSNYILIPARGLVSFAFFDSWHTPACVLGQITTTGRLIFIDTLRLEGADIRTLIDNQVIPLINSPKWKDKPFSWRIGGDFTMNQPDQSNRREKASKVVEEAFPGYFFEPGPSKWETIKRHVAHALQGSDNRGEPLVLLSADNRMLDKGFRGGWHYPKDNAGNVHHNAKPVKDLSSHPCDAAGNAVSVLLPTADVKKFLANYRQIAQKAKQRVQSYATGGAR